MNFLEFRKYFNSKYPNPKVRGKRFEPYAKWFLENDPYYYKNFFKKIWLWNEWPENWGMDQGIDLVGEDNDGRIWAIQSKNIDENNIVKDKVDSFIANSNRKIIFGLIIMYTTNKVSKPVEKQLDNNQKPTLRISLKDFERINDWPKSLKSKLRIKKKFPEKHQKIAIENVVKGFKKEPRGQMIMACGTGKTLTGLWIKEKIKSKRNIIFFPSIGLLADTLREYLENKNDDFNFLCVCSDSSVSKPGEDELDDRSIYTTTETKEIRKFINKNRNKNFIIFSDD